MLPVACAGPMSLQRCAWVLASGPDHNEGGLESGEKRGRVNRAAPRCTEADHANSQETKRFKSAVDTPGTPT